MQKLFTSESVTTGHPDKVCDQISDAILDKFLEIDPDSHVAIECFAAPGTIIIGGEVNSQGVGQVDIEGIARQVLLNIGYDSEEAGLDGNTCQILLKVGGQSPDINEKVNESLEACSADRFATQGAGDQGMMFGYACRDTMDLMPAPITLAHLLARNLEDCRKSGTIKGLLPDGKTQVTFAYTPLGNNPVAIDTILVSAQHTADKDIEELRREIQKHVIDESVDMFKTLNGYVSLNGHITKSGRYLDTEHTKVLINPVGKFVIGGPAADTGLTGRKIIVDTYGGFGHHGGGAFSGKDASKVDRTGAYVARHMAKHAVARGYCDRCEVQIAYAIGVANPVSVSVDTFGTAAAMMTEDKIAKWLKEEYDLRPAAIIERFGLKKPIFSQYSAYGHFGTEAKPLVNCPWEDLER